VSGGEATSAQFLKERSGIMTLLAGWHAQVPWFSGDEAQSVLLTICDPTWSRERGPTTRGHRQTNSNHDLRAVTD